MENEMISAPPPATEVAPQPGSGPPAAAPAREGVEAAPQPGRGPIWSRYAMHFAGDLAGRTEEPAVRARLAALRRMSPLHDDLPPAFARFMAERGLGAVMSDKTKRVKWALILHGIALMTSATGDSAASRSAHAGGMPIGRALFEGPEPGAGKVFYSETRLQRLLIARNEMLYVLLERVFRTMGRAGVKFNWWDMAQLIGYSGCPRHASETRDLRYKIAGDYYRAEMRYRPAADSEKDEAAAQD